MVMKNSSQVATKGNSLVNGQLMLFVYVIVLALNLLLTRLDLIIQNVFKSYRLRQKWTAGCSSGPDYETRDPGLKSR
jgi:hypothetical protein